MAGQGDLAAVQADFTHRGQRPLNLGDQVAGHVLSQAIADRSHRRRRALGGQAMGFGQMAQIGLSRRSQRVPQRQPAVVQDREAGGQSLGNVTL